MRRNRSGFTMIEMLVVVSLIIAMSTLAMGAFGAFLASKKIRLSTQIVSNALRTARQFAVSNRLPCMVEFIDADLNQAPGTDQERDQVVITPFEAVVDPQTGELTYVLTVGPPLFRKYLSRKVHFLQIPPTIHSDGTPVSVAINHRLADGTFEKRQFISAMIFLPSGGMRTATYPSTSTVPATSGNVDNTIQLEDTVSQERSRVYCYPLTGYTRAFYDEE
jgi:prepilin-type N-terminal cleavage/methylation domain-containing protein